MTQAAIENQQIMQKIARLTPPQKQTVYAFIDFLLSKEWQRIVERPPLSALEDISVWDEHAIDEIKATQAAINSWQQPTACW